MKTLSTFIFFCLPLYKIERTLGKEDDARFTDTVWSSFGGIFIGGGLASLVIFCICVKGLDWVIKNFFL